MMAEQIRKTLEINPVGFADFVYCSLSRFQDAIGKCKAYLGNATSEQLATPYASAISCFGLTVGGSPKARAICNGLDKQRTGGCEVKSS